MTVLLDRPSPSPVGRSMPPRRLVTPLRLVIVPDVAARPLPPLTPPVTSAPAPVRPAGSVRSAWPRQLSATTTSAPKPLVRLTPRGRMLCVVVAAVCVMAVLALSATHANSPGSMNRDASRTVVVQPGDTVWQIALSVAPDQDPTAEVAKIRSLNGLTTAPLQPGTTLLLPIG